MLIFVTGLIVFMAAHFAPMVLGEKRFELIQAGRRNLWRGPITLLSIVGIVLISIGYGSARPETVLLYQLPFWVSHITILLVWVAFVLMAQSYFGGKLAKAVKHPQLLAVKLWAVGHLLVNGDSVSVILFGSFLVWAVIARISLKRRVASGLAKDHPGGPVRNDIISVLIGTVIFIVFVIWAHEFLFGVVPFIRG